MLPENWFEELKKLIRFGLVGVLNTGLTLGTIYLVQRLLGWDYRVANFLGYALGIINSFVLNRVWTFKSQDTRIARQSFLFLVIAGVCYLVQYGVLNLSVELFESDKALFTRLGLDGFSPWLGSGEVVISHLVGMIAYTGLNYLGNRLVVFSRG